MTFVMPGTLAATFKARFRRVVSGTDPRRLSPAAGDFFQAGSRGNFTTAAGRKARSP